MALTSAVERSVKLTQRLKYKHLNVPASTAVYTGAIVTLDAAGNGTNAPVTGATFYLGIAQNTVDNSAVAAATTTAPLVVENGHFEKMTMDVAPAVTDIGKPVYYVDNDAVSLTIVAGTGVAQSQVGILYEIISGTSVWIDTSKAVSA